MRSLEAVLQDWEAVIGLEVHTELTALKTKMFCSCKIEFGAEPNTHVCPVCLGLPGALPAPNKAAIESIVLAGLATGCEIEKRSMFYRKNYFYPDMSKNFQTTQGPVAFCMRGSIDLEVTGLAAKERSDLSGTILPSVPLSTSTPDAYLTRIGITRIHMEEDAGKMIHVGGVDGRITGADYSLLDYNRCGTPLIELVTEPDLRTPEEARLFLQKLRQIYLTLDISDCSMEEGSLRCDGNVSLRRRGETTLGTKTELKNMNSFKNLHDGLAYEICRQAEVLESGATVLQETRHWEPASKRTVSMRVKETADDYRLFPEPDLAPYDLTDEFIEAVRTRLPELPDAKKQRFIERHGLPYADAITISADVELARFFDATLRELSGDAAEGELPEGELSEGATLRELSEDATRPPALALARPVANLLINDVTAWLNANSLTLAQSKLTPAQLAQLAQLVTNEIISSKQGKEVLALAAETGEAPAQIIEQRGMKQVSDTGIIETIVDTVLATHPQKVEEYRNGKTGLLGFFVGQAMQASKGQGNPKLINEVILSRLEK
ncbi:MAG: Asp-tRNA(Asn)/Glu-tRNA(Gln) amidotransferase subunit GatB [Coriobacteriales bacterium]|jgi:aspartyl-tRNA(Asn)/glutamyl-tRNA(Gln) amidotransferase subunit B|nr:Asp-tRNA(Asn)/Glu-tRNA(Gln) amidotransferase subunit GatB [Coriobacteriales bacterium]